MTQNPQLPIDPDTGPDPFHQLHPAHIIGLVIAGGSAGTLLRVGLIEIFPQVAGITEGVFVSNLVGALFLGFLLERLLRAGPETHNAKRTRLLLGTGFAGGFTTYSSLALNSAQLLLAGDMLLGIGYGLGTVLFGAGATFIGILLGTRVKEYRQGEQLQ